MFQATGWCTKAGGKCVFHTQGRTLNTLSTEILLHRMVGFSGAITLVFHLFLAFHDYLTFASRPRILTAMLCHFSEKI